MFNFQGSELIIILLLALVVLGPEKLPDAMRRMGQFYAELKKMSSSFQREFKAAVDEPVREMRETANLLRDSADFRRLQDGSRAEKPKSAEMPVIPSSPAATGSSALTDAMAGGVADDVAEPEPATEADGDAAEPAPQPFSAWQRSSAAAPAEAPDAGATPNDPLVDAGPQVDAAPGEPADPVDPAPAPLAPDQLAPVQVEPDQGTTGAVGDGPAEADEGSAA